MMKHMRCHFVTRQHCCLLAIALNVISSCILAAGEKPSPTLADDEDQRSAREVEDAFRRSDAIELKVTDAKGVHKVKVTKDADVSQLRNAFALVRDREVRRSLEAYEVDFEVEVVGYAKEKVASRFTLVGLSIVQVRVKPVAEFDLRDDRFFRIVASYVLKR